MRLLRQIVHEASGSVAVVLSERFLIGPFQERQTWEKKRIFTAGVHCSSSSLRGIAKPHLSGIAHCWIPVPLPRAIFEAQGCGCPQARTQALPFSDSGDRCR
jgi:hypothetical protein